MASSCQSAAKETIMFGILDSTLRIASRSDKGQNSLPRRAADTKVDAQLAKVRFRTPQEAAEWARKL